MTTWLPELKSAGEASPAGPSELAQENLASIREAALSVLREVELLTKAQAGTANESLGLSEEVRRYETELIREALQRTHGNQRRAAKLLGVKVTTLNCKMKRFGISSNERAGSEVENAGLISSERAQELALLELRSLCLFLETDVQEIEDMPLSTVKNELQELGLDPEAPLPEYVSTVDWQSVPSGASSPASSRVRTFTVIQGSASASPEGFASTSSVPSVSFDEVFTLYHRTVFRTARAVLGDAALAEDVTQEVFLRLYRHFDGQIAEGALRVWLVKATVEAARHKQRGSEYSNEIQSGSRDEDDERFSTRRLEIQEARRALDKIKEPMRSCLLLKQQGLSYREIAATPSLKETSIGSLIHRGRLQFARVYGKIGGRR